MHTELLNVCVSCSIYSILLTHQYVCQVTDVGLAYMVVGGFVVVVSSFYSAPTTEW